MATSHPRAALRLSVALHEGHTEDLLEHVLHAQADSALPITESAISLTTAHNDSGNHPTNLNNHINLSSFLHDDFTGKLKKFSIVLEVIKLADSDIKNVRDLYANEHRKDGLESKSIEKV